MASKDANHSISHWQAWQDGISKAHQPRSKLNDLEKVILRGKVYAAVTSKVEQSFSLIDERLGQQKNKEITNK